MKNQFPILLVFIIVITFISCAPFGNPVVVDNRTNSVNMGGGVTEFTPTFIFNQDVYLTRITMKSALQNYESQSKVFDYNRQLVKKGEEFVLPKFKNDNIFKGIAGGIYYTIEGYKTDGSDDKFVLHEVSR